MRGGRGATKRENRGSEIVRPSSVLKPHQGRYQPRIRAGISQESGQVSAK